MGRIKQTENGSQGMGYGLLRYGLMVVWLYSIVLMLLWDVAKVWPDTLSFRNSLGIPESS
jgi:hypothetical protein